MLNAIFAGIRFVILCSVVINMSHWKMRRSRQQWVLKLSVSLWVCLGLKSVLDGLKSPGHCSTKTVIHGNGDDVQTIIWCDCRRGKGPGRPPISREIQKLVRSMAAAIRSGAHSNPRRTLKLGFEVSERTVSR